MPRALLVAVIGSILTLIVGLIPPAFAASAVAPAPAPVAASGAELVAANPNGASSVILVVNYERAAGRNMHSRLAAFARANPDIKVIVRPVGGGGPLADFLAKAAYAAGRQGKFAAFHEYALAAPIANTWYSLRDNAAVVGLDWARFQRDYMDPAFAEDVRANAAFAEEQKVTAPAVVAGGRAFSGPLETMNLTEIAAAARTGGSVIPAAAR
ncbi:MAG: DsbA family protein [Rhodospirillaceae bacterium]